MAVTTEFGLEMPTPGGYRNTWGGTLNTTITKISELLAVALPLGTIQMYPLATAPVSTTNGGTWLICNGASLSRATYEDLHDLIGETYGSVDGNTFNLPDMRARSPLGYNTTAGLSGSRSTRPTMGAGSGVETHALSEAELEQHSHAITGTTHTHGITEPNSGTGHTHTGANSGKTSDASTGISSPAHTHPIERWHDSGSDSPTHQVQINYLSKGKVHSTYDSESTSAPITDPEHSHSITTTATVSGVTVDAAQIGITSTNETGSSTPHENMHPYLVIQYIILAKLPSF